MDKKNIWVLAGGAVVLLALGFFVGKSFGGPSAEYAAPATSTEQVSGGPAAPAAPVPSAPAPKPSGTGTTLSRDAAYKYYSGKQLYTKLLDCVGYPMNFIFKVGTKFMVENGSTLPAAFTVRDQSFIIPGKGFVVITATQSGVYDAMCNGAISLKLQVSPQ